MRIPHYTYTGGRVFERVANRLTEVSQDDLLLIATTHEVNHRALIKLGRTEQAAIVSRKRADLGAVLAQMEMEKVI